MTEHAHILTLAQWLSPAYPVGSFAYSHGLEAAVQAGWVRDGRQLGNWLEDVLSHGSGRNDATLIAAAYNAPDPEALLGVEAIARAFAASRERLLETDQQGAAFCRVTAAIWGAEIDGLTYPVALGRAAYLEGLPQTLTAKMYLSAMVSNLIAAGQRLLPLGQTAAQGLHRALSPLCLRIAEETSGGAVDQLAASAFISDIASMKHETQYSRIFRT
ncbi:urease accessory UreF family protein [Roseovarius sp. CAU 1744]|uniref:urease accessory protein UreF n=1 Tax=Roseovarius sp. CAU 1744 TaxID=3140368 RepID=UPI00325A8062